MMPAGRAGDGGFTLVELLVALALFSVIALAGFTVLSGTLRTQSRTEHRLERLADLQRALHLLTLDLEQIADGDIRHDGTSLAFRRADAARAPGRAGIRYDLRDGSIRRTVSAGLGSGPVEQALLDHVAALHWRFYSTTLGWLATWPPEGDAPGLPPAAIAALLTVEPVGTGPGGELLRIVRLPSGRLP